MLVEAGSYTHILAHDTPNLIGKGHLCGYSGAGVWGEWSTTWAEYRTPMARPYVRAGMCARGPHVPGDRLLQQLRVAVLAHAVAQAVELGELRGPADAHVVHDPIENLSSGLLRRGAALHRNRRGELGLEPSYGRRATTIAAGHPEQNPGVSDVAEWRTWTSARVCCAAAGTAVPPTRAGADELNAHVGAAACAARAAHSALPLVLPLPTAAATAAEVRCGDAESAARASRVHAMLPGLRARAQRREREREREKERRERRERAQSEG